MDDERSNQPEGAVGVEPGVIPPATAAVVERIANERQRQIEREGWTEAHDDGHARGEMAQAAACYAYPPPRPIVIKRRWPWDPKWWKPTLFSIDADEAEKRQARVRDLVKAAALIVAEIERLERIEAV